MQLQYRVIRRISARQTYHKPRGAGGRIEKKASSVVLDNPPRDAKPKTRALAARLRGHKRLKDFGAQLLCDAGTAINDRQLNSLLASLHLERDPALLLMLDGVAGVVQK